MTTRGELGRLAILGYHHIGEPSHGQARTRWYLSEKAFEEHLSYLRDSGWNVVAVDTFLQGVTQPEVFPAKPVLITFDDCHRSLRDVALRLLQPFGYPALAFAPTDFIGAHNTYDIDCAPQEPLCSWQDLQELEAAGVSIQSHSATHRGLSWLEADEQEEELRRSKKTLEEHLSKRVDVFAFPYGDDKVAPLELERLFRKTNYRAACLFGGGTNPLPLTNPYRLERIAIESTSDLPSLLAS
jgi:peptidoglycan/xylan/chitin deacetylase (PgdA/CDA1 family)